VTEPSNHPESPDGSSLEIANKLEPLFKPDKKEQGLRVVATYMQKIHRGPLPAPEDFEHYNQSLPGAGERILRMAEKQQDHRHGEERRMVTLEYLMRMMGQLGALLALVSMLGTVAYCAMIHEPVTAGVIAAIGGIVIAFLKYTARVTVETEEPTPRPTKKKRSK